MIGLPGYFSQWIRSRERARQVVQSFQGRCAVGVVEGIVKAVALDDLIDGHGGLVVRLGPHGDDRVVLDVGPDFPIFRRRQPNTLIAALVKEVPGSVLEPGRRACRRARG